MFVFGNTFNLNGLYLLSLGLDLSIWAVYMHYMLSKIVGTIDRRILLNFRAPPEMVRKLLPKPFSPRIVNGHALIGVCLIRFKELRPHNFPTSLALSTENSAHRISIEWQENREFKTGVYVMRRDTDSKLVSLGGGSIFPGVHSHAKFRCEESENAIDIEIHDREGKLLKLSGQISPSFHSEVFSSHKEASQYFKLDQIGYSPSKKTEKLEGLKLNCHEWKTQNLSVSHQYVREFKNQSHLIKFDHALIMRQIEHDWTPVNFLGYTK